MGTVPVSGASDYRRHSIIPTPLRSTGTVPVSGIEYLGMNQGFVSLARGLCKNRGIFRYLSLTTGTRSRLKSNPRQACFPCTLLGICAFSTPDFCALLLKPPETTFT